MVSSRKERWKQLQSAIEPGFGRMLLISLLVHLLVPILYYTPLFPKSEPLKPPIYRVNLVNKPVKHPQAGRPEAVVSKKPPKPKPAPVKPKPIPPKPKSTPVKSIPKPKPVAKPEPKPTVSKTQEANLQQRLEQLRADQARKQAEQERKAKLDALRAAAVAESQKIVSPVTDAPVGMPEGKGDEAGVAAVAFVQEFIRQQWSLSKYQVSGNPQAEVLLVYNADGQLQHYRFLDKSGNAIFDDSLVAAIIKSKKLNQPLPEEMEFNIVFNLKEMLDQP